jgi:gamma-glutamyl-gamma-aminobutyrate hydrolase PuuD
VLLPPVPGIVAAVPRLDGLVLTGGGDIDPAAYGADPHPRTGRVSKQRDRAELELLAACLAGGLPVLGICRGLQLLNVARGGTLHQHLADVPLDAARGGGGPRPPGRSAHSPPPGTFGSHPVWIAPGSRLAEILGPAGPSPAGELSRTVPTAHHQAIDRLGDGLTAAAWAADGLIEAAELGIVGPGQHPFVLAVQWHPEAGEDPSLFQALVTATTSPAPGRRPAADSGPVAGVEPLDSRP